MSSALVPEPASIDILTFPEKGQTRYEWLLQTRIPMGSPKSIWDRLPQLKLKRFANWMPKTSIKVGNKIYKLREDKEFMSKCVVLSRSRPELLGKLDELIGHYEMSVFPRCRALFSSDGRLFISKDMSHLMNLIIEKQPQRQISNKAEELKNSS